jgi:hypothetical protein
MVTPWLGLAVGKSFRLSFTAHILMYTEIMPRKEKNVHKNSPGRPMGRRYAGNIPCRLPPETLAAVDKLAASEDITRSEAIRRLIEIALAVKTRRLNPTKNGHRN